MQLRKKMSDDKTEYQPQSTEEDKNISFGYSAGKEALVDATNDGIIISTRRAETQQKVPWTANDDDIRKARYHYHTVKPKILKTQNSEKMPLQWRK